MVDKRAHLIVRGSVQGVGYRFFASTAANRIGIKGWVKNQPDGSVAAIAEGQEEKIEEFIEALRHKHPWAKVNAIEVEWQPYTAEFHNFDISY